jgi:hypothetical protein
VEIVGTKIVPVVLSANELIPKHLIPASIIRVMMEAASSSETSVNFYQTTWRNIPEDSQLHTTQISTRMK